VDSGSQIYVICDYVKYMQIIILYLIAGYDSVTWSSDVKNLRKQKRETFKGKKMEGRKIVSVIYI
jgi:hypothetical protein